METEEKQEEIKKQLGQLEPENNRLKSLEKFWFIPAILALVAIIIVGTLWVTNKGLRAPKPSPSPVPIASPSAEIDAGTAALEKQGTSDEISAIEADLYENSGIHLTT